MQLSRYEIHFSLSDVVLSSRPEMKDIKNLLLPIDYMWYELGEALYVGNHFLQGLRRSIKMNIEKLFEVVHQWFREFPDACWVEIINVVEGPLLNNHKVTMDIRNFLMKPEIQAKYVSSYDEWNT